MKNRYISYKHKRSGIISIKDSKTKYFSVLNNLLTFVFLTSKTMSSVVKKI